MNAADLARFGYGTLLLIDSGRLVRPTADHRFRVVIRVLGARHVIQALIGATWPTTTARRLGSAIDGLHAATDIGCAVVDQRWRPAAVVDASVAIALAVATMSVAWGAEP